MCPSNQFGLNSLLHAGIPSMYMSPQFETVTKRLSCNFIATEQLSYFPERNDNFFRNNAFCEMIDLFATLALLKDSPVSCICTYLLYVYLYHVSRVFYIRRVNVIVPLAVPRRLFDRAR